MVHDLSGIFLQIWHGGLCKNGRTFIYNNFKWISWDENNLISITFNACSQMCDKIECVFLNVWLVMGNCSMLVQVIVWHRTCDKPLPEPMLTYSQLDPQEQTALKQTCVFWISLKRAVEMHAEHLRRVVILLGLNMFNITVISLSIISGKGVS